MQKKKQIEVTIYTDGGCQRNPGGKGGIGVVLLHKKARKEISQGYIATTNNRMELMAVIEGFKALKGRDFNVTVFSDSQYVIDPIMKGWLSKWRQKGFAGKKNVDLWKELHTLISAHTVRFVWVRGHDCTVENNRCDQLATLAMKSNNLIPDHGYEVF